MSSVSQEHQAETTPAHGVEQLVVVSNDPAEAPDWQDEKTVLLPAASGGRSTVWLELAGNDQRFELSHFPVTLGRHPDCDIVLTEDGVSRRHASILKVDGGYAVEDNGSLNGIRINDYSVDRVLLGDGDRIDLGAAEVVFHCQVAAKKSPQQRKKIIRFVAVTIAVGVIAIYAYKWINNTPLTPQLAVLEQPTAVRPASVDPEIANSNTAFQIEPDAATNVAVATLSDSNILVPTSEQITAARVDSDALASKEEDLAENNFKAAASLNTSVKEQRVAVDDEAVVSGNTPNDKTVTTTPSAKPARSQTLSTSSPLISPGALEVKPARTKTPPALLGVARSQALIEQAQEDYLAGEAETAFADLEKMADSNRHRAAQRDAAAQLKRELSDSYDFYLAGQSALANNKDQAFTAWQDFLESEQALLLPRRSAYAERVSESVFNEYRARAEAATAKNQHHAAYRYWQQAAAIQPDSDAEIALLRLDEQAQALYRDGYRKETINLTQARTHWQAVIDLVPPGTEYHTKARAKLRWYAYLRR